jgi:hypothetical protein
MKYMGAFKQNPKTTGASSVQVSKKFYLIRTGFFDQSV